MTVIRMVIAIHEMSHQKQLNIIVILSFAGDEYLFSQCGCRGRDLLHI
jgi:hypothetical protein